MSFRAKLIGFTLLLVIGLQAVNLVLVTRGIERQVLEVAKVALSRASVIFDAFLEKQILLAQESASLSAKDFTVKEYLAGEDLATKASVVNNIRARAGSDWAMYVTLDGETEVGVNAPLAVREMFPFPSLIENAALSDDGTWQGFARIDDAIHILFAVAVDAPRTLGYFVAGNRVDTAFLQRQTSQLPLELSTSFIHGSDTNLAIVSTLAQAAQADLAAQLAMGSETVLAGERMIGAAQALQTVAEQSPVTLAFHASLDQALGRSRGLLLNLYGILAVSAILAIIGGLVFSRGLIGPVHQLAGMAEKARDGDYDAIEKAKPRQDEFGLLSNSFATMIDRVREREGRLSYLAGHDQETGLLNRNAFMDLESDLLGTVGIIEIASLPEIDYVFGRQIGGEVMVSLAERLRALLPEEAILARIGDAAFAIACKTQAEELGTALVELLDQPLEFGDKSLDLSVRLGMTAGHAGAFVAKAALHQAEAALYRARETDQTLALFDPDTDAPNSDRLTLMSEMRSGLDAGEFVLYFQPKLGLANNRVEQAEALIRWFHPSRGFMPPDMFIELAEQAGRIHLLTDWVIGSAVDTLKKWRTMGIDVTVAINLSTKDLTDRSLPQRIVAKIEAAGLSPHDLALEVTESAAMDHSSQALAVMQALRDQGHSLSIDDFGTGYSSLQYLQRLPVEEIKIDRAFVKDVLTSKSDQAITAATIDLTHRLDRVATAEGVEDQATLDLLRSMGCDKIQGYFLAKPMKADDFELFVQKQAAE